jgi:hypothetical protein
MDYLISSVYSEVSLFEILKHGAFDAGIAIRIALYVNI